MKEPTCEGLEGNRGEFGINPMHSGEFVKQNNELVKVGLNDLNILAKE